MPANTPIGTLYRRAAKRVDRRAARYLAERAAHLDVPDACVIREEQLLREACRLANHLAQSLPVRPRRTQP